MKCIYPGCGIASKDPFCDEHVGLVPTSLHSELYEKAQEYTLVRQAAVAWMKLEAKLTPSPEEMQALRSRL